MRVLKPIKPGHIPERLSNTGGADGSAGRPSTVLAGAVVAAVLLALAPPPAGAEAVTPAVAISTLAERKQQATIPRLRLAGRYHAERFDEQQSDADAAGGEQGIALEDLGAPPLELGYITLGTPARNAKGEIVNAIAILSDDWGDATTSYARWVEGHGANGRTYPPPVGPGALIDTDRHYVVLLDGLGLFGTAKPSAGLGPRFPRYGLLDGVQASYRLLHDHLEVADLRLVAGESLGGAGAWAFAALHPEFVKAALPVAGTTAINGDDGDPVARWTLMLTAAAIEADPAWRRSEGVYYALPKAEHPNRGVAFGFSVFDLFTRGLDAAPAANGAKPDVFSWTPAADEGQALAERAASYDAVDLLWRVRAAAAFTLNPFLGRIRAPVLAIHREDDPWLTAGKTAAAVSRVAGAEMITLPADAASGRDVLPALAGLASHPSMQAFRERAGLADGGDLGAPEVRAQPPRVAPAAALGQGFWQAQVTYPFPTPVAAVTDGSGRAWEIAYMDAGPGAATSGEAAAPAPTPAAPALLMLHDRGLTAAVFGETMAFAARRGLRVIAPDLPPYGLSGPGNIDRPWTRTLADLRAMITDLVRGRLGLERIDCLGHGMGAQLCLGLALDHPDLVSRLILIAPEGLADEPAGRSEIAPADAIAAEMARGLAAIEAALLPSPDIDPAAPPLFRRDGAYARFFAEMRIGLAAAGRRELEQYATAFVADAYAAGIERLAGDPLSVPARAGRLSQPVMIALGGLAPRPDAGEVGAFAERLAAAGNPPLIRIYPRAGSVVAVDVPVEFSRDLVDFLAGRPVMPMTRDVLARLLAAPPSAVGRDRR